MYVTILGKNSVEQAGQQGNSDYIKIENEKVIIYWPDDGIVSAYDITMYDIFIEDLDAIEDIN